MIADHTKEKNKRKKGGRTRQPPFIMYVQPWQAQPEYNHDGIIHNIKPI